LRYEKLVRAAEGISNKNRETLMGMVPMYDEPQFDTVEKIEARAKRKSA